MKLHLLSIGLAFLSTPGLTLAQDSQADPQEAKPAIALYSGGMDQIFAHPMDQGLHRILGYLDERILELADDLGEERPPQPLVEFVMDLLRAPMSFRMGLGDLSQGLNPDMVWAQLDVKAENVEQAAALGERFEGFLGMLPFPLQEQPEQPGMRFIDMGNGMLIQLGARRMADGSGTYFVAWGEPRVADMDLASYGMPEDGRALFAAGVDLAELQPAIQMALAMAGEQAQLILPILERYNIVSEDAWSVDLAAGVQGDRMRSQMRMTRWVQVAKQTKQYTERRLTAADFAVIPADANLASLQVGNPSAVFEQVRLQAELDPGFDYEEIIKEINGFLGIDIEADLLNTFGQVQGFYTSDSTGGGGLTSMVMFIEIADEARLRQSMATLSEQFLGLAQGRARYSRWKHAGIDCLTINTPGLPVPLEFSLGFTGGRLFMGLTPGALEGALENALSKDAGILALPALARELPRSVEGALYFTYGDSASMARDGYSTISHFYSALANGALSPKDESRQFGRVMPSYRELMKQVHPALMLGWVEGDDLIMSASASPSVTANLVSMAGNPMLEILMVGLGLGLGMAQSQSVAAFPAEDVAWQEESLGSQVVSDLRMLSAGIDLYSIDHQGAAPARLEDLLAGVDGESYLWMDEVPSDPWGNAYHYTVSADSGHWHLVCYGSDGLPGGEGEAADIDNVMLQNGDY